MKDKLDELRILWRMLRAAHWDWKQNVRGRLDAYHCCNGDMCGCYGATVRSLYEWRTESSQEGSRE